MSELNDIIHRVPISVQRRYVHAGMAIREYQRIGYELREKVRQDPIRHGHLLTREMHPVEMEVVAAMCPAIRSDDPREKQKAWRWVLKQDWGKDLRASPYEQRYF